MASIDISHEDALVILSILDQSRYDGRHEVERTRLKLKEIIFKPKAQDCFCHEIARIDRPCRVCTMASARG